jgi:hypothetical protein
MKTLLTLGTICVVLTTTSPSFAQKAKKFPFQVVDSKNSYTAKGRSIEQFDFLTREPVTVKGYLHIVHYYGQPFTFEGDTIVNLKSLDEKLTSVSYPITMSRPPIEKLFRNEPFGAAVSAIHDYDPLFVYPPPLATLMHSEADDLCLRWKAGSKNYRLDVKNIYDDSLRTYFVDTNQFTLPSTLFSELKTDLNMLILSITFDNKRQSDISCRLLKNTDIHGLFQCDVKSAVEALLIGYYNENASLLDEAQQYYEFATKASDHEVFKEALNHFKNRRDRIRQLQNKN